MKLIEAWSKSIQPYKEIVYKSIAEEKGQMWWGSFGRGHYSEDGSNNSELTKKALRIAKFDKLLVSSFNIIAAIIPFMVNFFGSSSVGLSSAIALSMSVTFGFTTLYAIQTLTSYISRESSLLLSTLPLRDDEFSLITLFSFVRSVDYIVVGSALIQTILVGYYTGSIISMIIMFSSSLINSILAVAVALWFSRVFSKNLSIGGRSKIKTILRIIFVLTWGSLLLGVGLLISLPWYIVSSLEFFLQTSNQFVYVILNFFHPLSIGLTITNLNNSSIPIIKQTISLISHLVYFVLSLYAIKWILKTVKGISQGIGTKMKRVKVNDVSLRTKSPLFAYIIKDLKISSRNPSTALFLALPILETVIISTLIANFEVLRASTVLVSTLMGGIFILLIPLALLNSEGKGLEYTKTLPIKTKRIIISKSLVTTLAYIPVPIIILITSITKSTSSWLILLIPFIILSTIIASSIFEIYIFFNTVKKGGITSILNDLKKITIGFLTLIIPLFIYSISFLISFNHVFSIVAMFSASIFELLYSYTLIQ
jgi:predicted permease